MKVLEIAGDCFKNKIWEPISKSKPEMTCFAPPIHLSNFASLRIIAIRRRCPNDVTSPVEKGTPAPKLRS